MKRPSFQFYPGDWLKDAALRMCSVGARGLWIDMICLMHQGSEYGHLKVNHTPILPPNLARLLGATIQEVEGWLAELESVGVYSVDQDGCIFSKRMVRDEEIRSTRAAGGILGGNPALLSIAESKKKQSKKDTHKINLPPNLEPTPSSSSASSASSASSKKKSPPEVPPPGFDEFWAVYPRKNDKSSAIRVFKAINPNSILLAIIIKSVERHKALPQWNDQDGKFIPYPATWLNKRRWEDEGQAPVTTKATAQWAIKAGFANEYEATNAGCFVHSAQEFSNGQRIAEVSA